MISSIKRLEAYADDLRSWKRKKRTFESNVKNKVLNKKPLESEPKPDFFGIDRADIYAAKIREQILGKPIPARRKQ
jgi:hypothetical protein